MSTWIKLPFTRVVPGLLVAIQDTLKVPATFGVQILVDVLQYEAEPEDFVLNGTRVTVVALNPEFPDRVIFQ